MTVETLARVNVLTFSYFKEVSCHPYRASEYFTTNGGEVFEIPDDDSEVQAIIDGHDGELIYAINWVDHNVYTGNGTKIPSVY